MRRKDEELHTRRRAEILEAATALFAETGLHQTTMKQVCAAVGLSPGSLYRYFPSKEALIEALAASEAEANRALLAYLDAQPNVLEALVSAVPEILEVICARSYARLSVEITAEAARAPDRVQAFIAAEAELAARLAESLARGQRQGQVTGAVAAEDLARTVLALLGGLSQSCAFEPGERARLAVPLIRALRGLLAPGQGGPAA